MDDEPMISTLSQTTLVEGVGSVVYTPIQQDEITGEFVREVRAYAQGDSTGSAGRMMFTLQLRSPTREGIEFTTPSLQI